MHNKLSSRLQACTNIMDRDEDTLSFASLVQPNMQANKSLALSECPSQPLFRPSFEFRQEWTPPVSSPASLLFANGSILSQKSSPVDCKGLSSRKQCLKNGNGWRLADSVPKKVSFQEDVFRPKRSVSSPMTERRNDRVGGRGKMKLKREVEKNKGLFRSIFLVCRECRVTEPSKRVGNIAN